MILGAMLGVVIFLVFMRGENTRSILSNRIVKIESSSPCTGLTAKECAAKIFAQLTPKQRKQLLQKQIRKEVLKQIVRIQKQRLRSQVKKSMPNAKGVDKAPINPSGENNIPQQDQSTEPQNSIPQAPQQETNHSSNSKDHSEVPETPPSVDFPPVGPIDPPPIKIPTIPVPTIPIDPQLPCIPSTITHCPTQHDNDTIE